jgi:hypothetical protein
VVHVPADVADLVAAVRDERASVPSSVLDAPLPPTVTAVSSAVTRPLTAVRADVRASTTSALAGPRVAMAPAASTVPPTCSGSTPW